MNERAQISADIRPTKDTYDALQRAYERLNTNLFAGELPNCLITLQRRRRTFGYFSSDRFAREDGMGTDEIALNPAHFRDRSLTEVLATLAHEMVHLWQHHFGAPGRGRYHNKEWATKMKAIGLQPTDTGAEGGKETGDRVTHIIIDDARFARVVDKLIGTGFTIPWAERPEEAAAAGAEPAGRETESKSGKRVKYVCEHEGCEQKAWAKHEANLVCGEHMARMVPAS